MDHRGINISIHLTYIPVGAKVYIECDYFPRLIANNAEISSPIAIAVGKLSPVGTPAYEADL